MIQANMYIFVNFQKNTVLPTQFLSSHVIVRPFQVFSMFSFYPGMQNLPTYPEKTNKAKSKNNIYILN